MSQATHTRIANSNSRVDPFLGARPKTKYKKRKKNNPGLSFSHRVLSILRFAFGVTLRTRGSFGMVRLAAASSFSRIFVVYLLPGLKSLAAARA